MSRSYTCFTTPVFSYHEENFRIPVCSLAHKFFGMPKGLSASQLVWKKCKLPFMCPLVDIS